MIVPQTNCTVCPDFAVSPAGSNNATDCLCLPGFYGEHGGECSVCPIASFCEGGDRVVRCAEHSNSSEGSNRSEDCSCDAGWYGPPGGVNPNP